jgi:hypothetical protein
MAGDQWGQTAGAADTAAGGILMTTDDEKTLNPDVLVEALKDRPSVVDRIAAEFGVSAEALVLMFIDEMRERMTTPAPTAPPTSTSIH